MRPQKPKSPRPGRQGTKIAAILVEVRMHGGAHESLHRQVWSLTMGKPTRFARLCAIASATRFQFCASTLLFASRSRRRASAYARTA